jgi:hypothetical protein
MDGSELCGQIKILMRERLTHSAFDGYSEMSVPTVDGTSFEAKRAVYQLMLEVTRLAQTANAA